MRVLQTSPSPAVERLPVSRPASSPGARAGTVAAAHDAALYGTEAMLGEVRDLCKLAAKLDPGRPAAVVETPRRDVFALAGSCRRPVAPEGADQPAYCHDFFYGPGVGHGRQPGRLQTGLGVLHRCGRSAVGDRPIWCTEWNQQWWGPAFRSPAGLMRLMTWTAVAEGLRGVFALQLPEREVAGGELRRHPCLCWRSTAS